MNSRFKELSYEEIVEMAKKDITYIKEDVFPLLKSKKFYKVAKPQEIITLLQEIINVYMNVGANISYFHSISSNPFAADMERKEAQKLYEEFRDISIETDVILEMKREEEKE